MRRNGARLILAAFALFSLTLFQNCGGAGGGDSSANASSNWYYHFDCNGDPSCLSTNPTGGTYGDLNEGPAQAACTTLVNFANNFWNAPASSWCDTNPTGSIGGGGAGGSGAPVITSLNSYSGPGNLTVAVNGSHFPSNAIGITASYCGRSIQVTGSNSILATVKIPFGISCKSPITITTAAGSANSAPYTRYNTLRSAASSGSLIIVTGDAGTIFSSTDGVSWAPRNSNLDASNINCGLEQVNWNGSQFLAVGENGYVIRSLDGITWSEIKHGGFGTYYALIWTGSQYVAGGSTGLMQTSPDGGTWTNGSAPVDVYFGLAYNGSTYVTASQGTVSASSNASSWNQMISAAGVFRKGVAWSGTEFMVVGSQGVVNTSPDGGNINNWLASNAGTSFDLNGIAWGNNKYVAVGNSGTIVTYQSVGGWQTRSSGTGEHLYGISWTGSMFIALGAKNTLLTSPDGITWTVRSVFP